MNKASPHEAHPPSYHYAVDVSKYHIKPLGFLGRSWFYLSFIADFGLKFLRITLGHIVHWDFPIFEKRTRQRVLQEYDQEAWRSFLEGQSWLRAASLRDALVPPGNAKRVDLVEGKLVKIRDDEHWDYRIKKLHRTITAFFPEIEANADERLIELGCGWGRNLFFLRETGLRCKMSGFDQSPTGIAAARSINQRFKTNIEFEQVDLIREDFPSRGDFIFTHLFLEQITYDVEAVLLRILSRMPRRVVHLEPVIEIYQSWHLKDLLGRFRIRSSDYITSLLSTLQKLERESRLRIRHVARSGIGSGPIHEITAIVWEPVETAVPSRTA